MMMQSEHRPIRQSQLTQIPINTIRRDKLCKVKSTIGRSIQIIIFMTSS